VNLQIIRDHLLLCLGDRLALIDTGAPMDIGRGRATELLGARWCPPSERAAVLDQAQDFIGAPIEWLLGAPVLERCRLLLDWSAGRAHMSLEPVAVPGATRVPVGFEQRIPRIDIEAAGRTVRAVLDSGAMLSYVPRAATRGAAHRRAVDFHPMAGSYETEVWRVPISIAGRPIELEAGVLPPALAPLAEAAGGWIIGSDFFRARTVVLDYPDSAVLDGPP